MNLALNLTQNLLTRIFQLETSGGSMTLLHHPDIEYLLRQVHSPVIHRRGKTMKIKANNFLSSFLLLLVLLVAMDANDRHGSDVSAQEPWVEQGDKIAQTGC